jgi:hypothetical protein
VICQKRGGSKQLSITLSTSYTIADVFKGKFKGSSLFKSQKTGVSISCVHMPPLSVKIKSISPKSSTQLFLLSEQHTRPWKQHLHCRKLLVEFLHVYSSCVLFVCGMRHFRDSEASRSFHENKQFLTQFSNYFTAWGYKEMSSIFAAPKAPSYTSPNAGGWEGVAGSQPMSTAVHIT